MLNCYAVPAGQPAHGPRQIRFPAVPVVVGEEGPPRLTSPNSGPLLLICGRLWDKAPAGYRPRRPLYGSFFRLLGRQVANRGTANDFSQRC